MSTLMLAILLTFMIFFPYDSMILNNEERKIKTIVVGFVR